MIIYACSSNAGKLRELALASGQSAMPDLIIEPLPELNEIPAPEETGATFEENAGAKALFYSNFTDQVVLAEDSGLEVNALGGAPGIYSARYAGSFASFEEHNKRLLDKLEDVNDRSARFVTVSALAKQGVLLATARGAVEGEILSAPRGTGGFGYDPVFFYPPLRRSFAELSEEEKFSVSARGRSLRSLLAVFSQHMELR